MSLAGIHLRRYSDGPVIPFLDPLVTLLHVVPEPLRVRQAASVESKINMLSEATLDSGFVLACWPGQTRQDVIWIDDLELANNKLWGEKLPSP